jgi:3-hydroxybutyryl-CoA dehydrogenase
VAAGTDLTVGVVGAGAMGSGIAQVASAAGHRVVLADARAGAAADARAKIARGLDGQVAKGKLTRADADSLVGRVDFRDRVVSEDVSAFRECGLVVEAIVEDLPAKLGLFAQLEGVVGPECILATNTSSLSVTALGGKRKHGARFIGLHFFNPAQVMPLVEVIPWAGTDQAVATQCRRLMEAWRKLPVIASDTPGFIVNRVARPFYGEAIRIAEEGIADYATIDAAMRDLGKFRMGPFELMDFIGNDVNFAVTKSVFGAMFFDPRYRPSLTQQRLVDAGFLGRKSGRGYYGYAEGIAKPAAANDPVLSLLVFERILAMLINEAADAVHMRVATPADIDLAMTKGVNYPKGLLAWCDEIGAERVLGWMSRLQSEYGEDRYRPSPLLRRMAAEQRRFFA